MVTDCDRSSSEKEKEDMYRITSTGTKLISKQLTKSALSQTTNHVRKLASANNPQNLPLLPVPKLYDTLNKYTQSVMPLLTAEEMCITQRAIQELCAPCGVGDQLQKFLEQRQKCTENWLLEWWMDTAYLGYRAPVLIHSSPGQTFPLQHFKNEDEWLEYAAQIIVGAASYKSLIDKKQLPLEKMGKDPLDMNQYNLILGTCRIPGTPKDSLSYSPKSNHIIVCHNNHFWYVQLFDDRDNKFLSVKQVNCILKDIVEKSRYLEEPVGILSAYQRDLWANSYAYLIQGGTNKATLAYIQRSLFLVCLDQILCPCGSENEKTVVGKQALHGGGSNYNTGNRWYDKTIQFIISRAGNVGITYEHSPSEGQPVANMVDYIHIFIEKGSGNNVPDNKNINTCPVKLNFCLTDKDRNNICAATQYVDSEINNLDMFVLSYTCYGKNFIKKQKLSPDSYIQMAFQYTYYRMYGRPGAQYESAATRKYLHGRTETIRSCSLESVNFAELMCSCATDQEKANALRCAIDAHKKYTVDAVNGFGVDRHLLGLKMAAKACCLPLPSLFEDKSYKKSTHFVISSSQVATKCDAFMCYGPVVEDGYGCCYNPRDDDITIAITAFRSCPETDTYSFACNLEQCLADMQKVLTCGSSKL